MAERYEVLREGWDTELSIDSAVVPARPPVERVPVERPSNRVPVERVPLDRPLVNVTASEDPTLPTPSGWTDGLTDTDGPRLWERLLAVEQARNVRHHRTATIVLVELVGMRAAVDQLGSAPALQQFVKLARFVAGDVRKSDHIARIRPARFGLLLTETDEISAINFVDRLRERCRMAFDPAATGFRIAVGWASPPQGGRLEDAMAVAEQRLTVELRQAP